MRQILASTILTCRGLSYPQLLMPWIEGDRICEDIRDRILALEAKYFESNSLRGYFVSWDEMQEIFYFPPEIDCYTIFFNKFSSTIGTIRNPTVDVLEHFFLRCEETCNAKFNWSNLISISRENQSLFNCNNSYLWQKVINENSIIIPKIDPFDHFKIKIISDSCSVYDFIYKRNLDVYTNHSGNESKLLKMPYSKKLYIEPPREEMIAFNDKYLKTLQTQQSNNLLSEYSYIHHEDKSNINFPIFYSPSQQQKDPKTVPAYGIDNLYYGQHFSAFQPEHELSKPYLNIHENNPISYPYYDKNYPNIHESEYSNISVIIPPYSNSTYFSPSIEQEKHQIISQNISDNIKINPSNSKPDYIINSSPEPSFDDILSDINQSLNSDFEKKNSKEISPCKDLSFQKLKWKTIFPKSQKSEIMSICPTNSSTYSPSSQLLGVEENTSIKENPYKYHISNIPGKLHKLNIENYHEQSTLNFKSSDNSHESSKTRFKEMHSNSKTHENKNDYDKNALGMLNKIVEKTLNETSIQPFDKNSSRKLHKFESHDTINTPPNLLLFPNKESDFSTKSPLSTEKKQRNISPQRDFPFTSNSQMFPTNIVSKNIKKSTMDFPSDFNSSRMPLTQISPFSSSLSPHKSSNIFFNPSACIVSPVPSMLHNQFNNFRKFEPKSHSLSLLRPKFINQFERFPSSKQSQTGYRHIDNNRHRPY